MRGMIMEIKEHKAILLTEEGRFMVITNRDYVIGQQINYFAVKPRYRRYMIAACLALFLCSGIGGYALYFTPASYVSVDINPSVQLVLNRFRRVIDTVGFNVEGKSLLQKAKIKNCSVEDSVFQLVEEAKKMKYLTDEKNEVVIDIVAKDIEIVKRVEQTLALKQENIDVTVENADQADLVLSKKFTISVGRAKALEEYGNVFGGTIEQNVEALGKVPVGMLKQSVKEKRELPETVQKTQQNGESNEKKEKKNSSAPKTPPSKTDAPGQVQKENKKNDTSKSTKSKKESGEKKEKVTQKKDATVNKNDPKEKKTKKLQ